MDTRIKFDDPGNIVAEISIKMKMKDWEALRDQLCNAWPSSDLSYEINDALSKARKIIWAEGKSPTPPVTGD